MQPGLTVVIPWVNRGPWIRECLQRLEAQTCKEGLEVIVYSRLALEETAAVADSFPRVRIESGLEGLSIPALRWRGMCEATAKFVAVIEDHSAPPPDWAARIIEMHEAGCDVVSGPVENASARTVFDWSFFLLEYSDVMPPVEPGGRQVVAGGNVSYRKSVLPLNEDRFGALWERFLVEFLRARGAKVGSDPGAVIGHLNPFEFGEFAGQKFLYSRSFAAMRAQGWGGLKRAKFAVAAGCILPVLLPFRLIRTVLMKRRNRAKLLVAFPMIIVLTACAIAVEIAGYVAGGGGSLVRVR